MVLRLTLGAILTLNVLDVSDYQRSAPDSILRQSQEILIVKATEGTGYVNPSMRRQVEVARKAGKLVGLYHFASYGEAQDQINYFYNNTKEYWGKGFAIPILDWENSGHSPAIVNYPDFAVAWLEGVKKVTGATPWIYANASVANNSDKRLHSYALWVAAYGNDKAQNGFNPQFEFSWVQGLLSNWAGPVIGWQHTQYGYLSGYGSNLDMNIFFADRAELESYAKGSGYNPPKALVYGERMVLPVGGAPITQNFGDNATVYNSGAGHSGTDFAVSVGTPVKASMSGTVIWADWADNLPKTTWENRWYLGGGGFGGVAANGGIFVLLQHNGFKTGYFHLSKTDLNIGDTVKVNQTIGLSGNTGSSTGPHLHYELLVDPPAWGNGYYGRVDPIKFTNRHNSLIASDDSKTSSKDWLDMATKEDVKNALREVFSEPFDKQGAPKGKTSYKLETSYNHDNVIKILNALENIQKRVDTIWGGIFVDFSYSGKPGTNEPGIIRLIKQEAEKTANLDEKLETLAAVAANGGTITNSAVSAVTGVPEERLSEILDEKLSSLTLSAETK